jgi:NodT family efflux transporter outer membrane factor (OMF) lipoprotein
MTFKPIVLVLLVWLLGACAHEDGPGLSAGDTPGAWEATVAPEAQVWPSADWWRGFGSEELNGLIVAAQANNLDLAAAATRVLQADAQARGVGAALLPSVSLGAGVSRAGPIDGSTPARSSFSLDLGASYEVDFWGRNASRLSAADFSALASRYDRETVALTVSSSVATSYLQILSIRDRIAIANKSLEAARGVLKITEARVSAGVAVPLELAQQRSNVAGQEAAIPGLQQDERAARAALALLVGVPMQGFDVKGVTVAGLRAPRVAAGLPSGLLARRPDVRQAEALLRGGDANIDAARAAFFPTISLSGSLGASSASLSTLLSGGNIGYAIGASLLQVIFDGGKLAADEDAAVARRQELLLGYRRTVISAFSDVDVALGLVMSIEEQLRLSQVQADQAAEAYRIATLRYRAGVEGFLSVLDSQRALNAAENQLATVRLLRLQASVALYRALGGGWVDGGS